MNGKKRSLTDECQKKFSEKPDSLIAGIQRLGSGGGPISTSSNTSTKQS